MAKYTASDIVIKSPGVQIREKIHEEYGSIKAFADAIDLYESSIHQYLSSKTLGSSTFKIRLTRAFGVDFHELYKTDEEQIRTFTTDMSWGIMDYNQQSDIDTSEKLKKLCLERELLEDYAIVCRCYAHYYFNQGKKDRAQAYMNVAVNTMRDRSNVDRFGLYLSDLYLMEAVDMPKPALKKLTDELLEVLDHVGGPLTRGHMYYNLGKGNFDLGNYDESEAYLKEVYDYHRGQFTTSFVTMLRGDIHKVLGEYEKALTLYRQAEVELEPGDDRLFHVYDEYASHYVHKGELDEAEQWVDLIFGCPKWHISATDHRFIEAFAMVKIGLGKGEELIPILKKLLLDVESGYIYTRSHLRTYGEVMEWKACPAKVHDQTVDTILKFVKKQQVDSEYMDLLKQILGSVLINQKS